MVIHLVENWVCPTSKCRRYRPKGCGDPRASKVHRNVTCRFCNDWIDQWDHIEKMTRRCGEIKNRGH